MTRAFGAGWVAEAKSVVCCAVGLVAPLALDAGSSGSSALAEFAEFFESLGKLFFAAFLGGVEVLTA